PGAEARADGPWRRRTHRRVTHRNGGAPPPGRVARATSDRRRREVAPDVEEAAPRAVARAARQRGRCTWLGADRAREFRKITGRADRCKYGGVPNGIRTRVLALKGPRPRPL